MRHRRSLIAISAYVGAAFAVHCSFTNDLDSLSKSLEAYSGRRERPTRPFAGTPFQDGRSRIWPLKQRLETRIVSVGP